MKITFSGTIIIEQPNRAPVFDSLPPDTTKFLVGTEETVVPWGSAHDPDGDPLTITLEPNPQGISIALQPDGQIALSYDGQGAPGTYLVEMILDDGKPE